MNLRDWYFKQRVSQAAMDEAFEWAEDSDLALAVDHGLTGIISGLAPTETIPASMNIALSGPGLATDKLGQRTVIADTAPLVDCSVDEYGVNTAVQGVGNQKWISVFVGFERTYSDPEIDGNGLEVMTRRWESARIFVRQAAENVDSDPPILVPLLTDALLICDVQLLHLQTAVTTSSISTDRREDWLHIDTGTFGMITAGTPQEAIEAVWDELAIIGVSGGSWSPTQTWYGSIALAGSSPPVTTVSEGLNAIIYDLKRSTGASRIGVATQSGTYLSWGTTSVAGALTAVAAAVNGHIGGAAPYHPASAVSFDDSSWQTAWSETFAYADVEAALNGLVTLLADETTKTGADRIGNDIILVPDGSISTGDDDNIPAGSVGTQLDGIGAALGDRAVLSKPNYISTKWEHRDNLNVGGLQVEEAVDKHFGTQLAKTFLGGTVPLGQSMGDAVAQIPNTIGGSQGVPWANDNKVGSLETGGSFYPSGICCCYARQDRTDYANNVNMRSRVIVSVSMNLGSPDVALIDPVTMVATRVTAATILASLPAGNWTAVTLTSMGDNRFVITFRDDTTRHYMQAWQIATSGKTVSRISAWPSTGVSIGTTGVTSLSLGYKQYACIMATPTVIAINKPWLATNAVGAGLATYTAATGAALVTGLGDAPVSADEELTGGLCACGTNLWFTTYNVSTNDSTLCHARITDMADTGIAGTPFVMRSGASSPSMACISDGQRIYATTPDQYLHIHDLTGGVNATLNGTASFTGQLADISFDGKNLWIQNVSAAGGIILWGIPAASLPSITGLAVNPFMLRLAMMNTGPEVDEAIAESLSAISSGRMCFDGDSMWCVMTAQDETPFTLLHAQIRRLPRCGSY